MITRLLTGLVIGPIAIASIIFGTIPMILVVLLCTILAAQELLIMLSKNGHKPLMMPAYFLLTAIIGSTLVQETSFLWDTTAAKIIFLGALGFYGIELILKRPIFPKNDLAVTLRVVLLMGGTFSFLYLIRTLPGGIFLVLYCCMLTWIGDIAALLVGKKFGKHPLSLLLSPKKTIEGAIGSLIVSLLLSWACALAFGLDIRLFTLYGVLISILGLLGDLHESMMKRFFHVKDSSNLLPGHGGMYDRADSTLFVMPVMYYLFTL